MQRSRKLLKLVAGLGAVAALGVACTSARGSTSKAAATPTSAHHHVAPAIGAVDGGASTLRAGLTSLLQAHVYLAGIATGEALAGHDLAAAAATLDKNSVELSQAIGSVYGGAAGTQFLDLWRKHIGFFVDYTKGRATKNQAMMDKAKADLDGYRNDFGAFISSANPNLPKEAVANELVPHIQTLIAAIDAQAAKSPTAFDKLKLAADHMPMTADILAGGIAKQFPDKFN